MNKLEVYQYLDSRQIRYEITEHRAVYNMAEAAEIALPYPEFEAKNLFVRDDKKRNYYLITVKGDKRVNLKDFKQKHQTRSLSFASDADLMSFLGLIPGAVTPLGLLNDEECRVQFFMDAEFLQDPGRIGAHPNDNTATIWLKAEDLLRILSEHGTMVHLTDI